MFLFDMVLSSWVSYPFCVYSRQSLNLYFSFRDFDFGENVTGRIYISRKSLFWRFTEKRREKEEKEREPERKRRKRDQKRDLPARENHCAIWIFGE